MDERVVHRWAEQAVERESRPSEPFFDIYADLKANRELQDTITILRRMRSMLRLPPKIYSGLHTMLVGYSTDQKREVIVEWLGPFAQMIA